MCFDLLALPRVFQGARKPPCRKVQRPKKPGPRNCCPGPRVSIRFRNSDPVDPKTKLSLWAIAPDRTFWRTHKSSLSTRSTRLGGSASTNLDPVAGSPLAWSRIMRWLNSPTSPSGDTARRRPDAHSLVVRSDCGKETTLGKKGFGVMLVGYACFVSVALNLRRSD